MKRSSWNSILSVFAAIVLLACPQVAVAVPSYFYDWVGGSSISLKDTYDANSPNAGQNIQKIWYASEQRSGGRITHYFRMDLLGSPEISGNLGNFYGIYINSKDGGAPNSDKYMPNRIEGITLSGIDFILSSKLDKEGSKLEWEPEFLRWKEDDKKFANKGMGDSEFHQINGTTLEWKVDDSGTGNWHINNNYAGFSFQGVTMANGKGFETDIVTPIPNAAWLLGGGVVALIGLKRRKTKK